MKLFCEILPMKEWERNGSHNSLDPTHAPVAVKKGPKGAQQSQHSLTHERDVSSPPTFGG